MGGVPSKPDPSRTLEVIGAGYSRTGTLSMQLALERLLDGPVMHGGTHVLSRGDGYLKMWIKALEAKRLGDKERTLKLVREVMTGYVSFTDIPGILFVPELLELYPEAKVVLVTRDPERWWKSFGGILDNADAPFLPVLTALSPSLRWFPDLVREWKKICDGMLRDCGRTPGEYGPILIEEHDRIVKEIVPRDRLLVLDLKEGWEPLCKFLDKPVPNQPFPRTNDAEVSDKIALRMFAKLGLMWLGLFTVMGGSAYMGWKLWLA